MGLTDESVESSLGEFIYMHNVLCTLYFSLLLCKCLDHIDVDMT